MTRTQNPAAHRPFVKDDRIMVSVDRSGATLGGAVTSWSQRAAAANDARQAGASAVVNQIIVLANPNPGNG